MLSYTYSILDKDGSYAPNSLFYFFSRLFLEYFGISLLGSEFAFFLCNLIGLFSLIALSLVYGFLSNLVITLIFGNDGV